MKSSPAAAWLRPELVASWGETAIVLFTFSGYFLCSSLLFGIQNLEGHHPWFHNSNDSMLRLASLESIMLAAMFAFLFHRGWRLEDLRIKRGWISNLQGLLLLVVWIGLGVGMMFFDFKWRHAFPSAHVPPGLFLHRANPLTWTVMILAYMVNAYWEEIIMTVYAFNQFASKCGPWIALFLTVLLRMSLHLWKDPFLLALTAGHFFLAGLVYWRTRNLWPLLTCHALYDILFSSRAVTEI